MSRTERLLDLLQILRQHRAPVSGATLASELDVSIRTLYRDIATLQGQGAEIEGEPGLGYVLKPGFMLPPLMFSIDELEALILGAGWVGKQHDDTRLSKAAGNALSKIASVLPADLRREIDSGSLYVVESRQRAMAQVDPSLLRDAIRKELKLRIGYRDDAGQETERVIWPVVIGFFEQHKTVGAWCELRQDFRHFRIDRIASLAATGERTPKRRHVLLREWREHMAERAARYAAAAAAARN
ncbi:MAG: YafY family transcriptional regulator [Hyphomicrobiales bacterium]|nr:MAG: YafY family transcriptional regulator [Hyphomicrobiales bacterium]